MFKLLKDTNKSIMKGHLNDLGYVLATFSCVILAFCIFPVLIIATNSEMHFSTVGKIAAVFTILAVIFGLFALFSDSHYKVNDDERFVVVCYYWAFFFFSGSIFLCFPFIIVYYLCKNFFLLISFCFEHFFMLFAPNKKKKPKKIVKQEQPKNQREVALLYDNFLKK